MLRKGYKAAATWYKLGEKISFYPKCNNCTTKPLQAHTHTHTSCCSSPKRINVASPLKLDSTKHKGDATLINLSFLQSRKRREEGGGGGEQGKRRRWQQCEFVKRVTIWCQPSQPDAKKKKLNIFGHRLLVVDEFRLHNFVCKKKFRLKIVKKRELRCECEVDKKRPTEKSGFKSFDQPKRSINQNPL